MSPHEKTLLVVTKGIREMWKIANCFPWEHSKIYGSFLSQMNNILQTRELHLVYLLGLLKDDDGEVKRKLGQYLDGIRDIDTLLSNDFEKIHIKCQQENTATRLLRRNQEAVVVSGDKAMACLGGIIFIDLSIRAIQKDFGPKIRRYHGLDSATFLAHFPEEEDMNAIMDLILSKSPEQIDDLNANVLETAFLFSAMLQECTYYGYDQ